MSGFNVVRYTVKEGMEDAFLSAHEDAPANFPGFTRGNLIKTGDRDYCYIGEWDSAQDSLNAEASMVAWLDSFRDTLEDRGDGKGVTDAIVGDSLYNY